MKCTFASKLLAVVLLILGAVAAPGSGVADGIMHHREAQHEAAHEAGGVRQDLVHRQLGVESDEPHGSHDDLRVDRSAPTRAGSETPLAAPPVSVAVVYRLCAPSGALFLGASLVRADPQCGPPPRLRAPPIG